jgi:hypothetical protein
MAKFQEKVIQTMEQTARKTGTGGKGEDTLDETLCQRVTKALNIAAAVDELQAVLDQACRASFMQTGPNGKALCHKSIPWWTSTYNTQKRRYKCMKNHELREQQKEQYLASKAEYAAAFRRENIKSWKDVCNVTSATNPWNAIYKMAAEKIKRATHITMLRLQDGSRTTNLQDTLLQMIHKFTPDDNQEDNTEIHRQSQALTRKPIDTEDEEFTIQEVTDVVQDMGNKKGPGEDGIPSEVWKCVGAILPRYLTAIYHGCLKEGVFPKRCKKARIIPIVKPGK